MSEEQMVIICGKVENCGFDEDGAIIQVGGDLDSFVHVTNRDKLPTDTQDLLDILDELEEYLEEKKEEYGDKHVNAKGLPSEIDGYAKKANAYRDALCRLQVLRDKYEEK